MQYEFMYFHYINDQKKYYKNISEKKFLNYYAVKNDVHDVKGTASDLSSHASDRPHGSEYIFSYDAYRSHESETRCD